MLAEKIKDQMFAAMKAKDEVAKEILRLALGEISTEEGRSGGELDDGAVEKIVRKLMKSNDETIELTGDEEVKVKLGKENEVLGALLPQSLSVEEIVAALGEVADAIKGAGNDGQATGIAMKTLKGSGAAVQGGDVAVAVKQMRA